ncbi:acyl-CoA thioesterase [Fulvivirga sp. RKSG066]|uniref:acyl-CoA thioesterase n=1 Tax=Fulvivirga aurantia TaxID=2529383 RepID=UPI0012BCA112|nr:thioesterase family protein [Fulvivirga aurantia]MTI19927.1 acyl-CoA thioesterase [Fulvivirga aurantia]
MVKFETQIRVRYADTDQMGYVYYGNYAAYYEIARVESLRSLGLTYKELEEQGVMMPVLENFSKYHAPATYDELLTVRTIIKEKPGVRITFDYEIYNESDKLIHEGKTLLVFVDMKSGRPCRQPEVMAKLLNPYFD